tara:strand:- start:19721 stop:20764 length:1044 start_codon:yes stop_codon:yes gene_type:complete
MEIKKKLKKLKKSPEEQAPEANWLDAEQASAIQEESAPVEHGLTREASMMSKIAFLFGIIALTASGTIYLEAYHKQQDLHQFQSQIQMEVTALQKNQKNQQQNLQSMMSNHPSTWVAAEVLYLLRIADRKLKLEHDHLTALNLIRESRLLIGTVQDPRFAPVFDRINEDIQYVESVQKTDVQTSITKLNDVLENVESLPLLIFTHVPDIQEMQEQPLEKLSDRLSQTWRALLFEVVTVRRHEAHAPALILPEQVWYLRENLRRQLLSAQLALYRQDVSTYQTAMRNLIQWVKQYADLKQTLAKKVLEDLIALEVVRIIPNKSMTLQSIAELENALDKKLKLTMEHHP